MTPSLRAAAFVLLASATGASAQAPALGDGFYNIAGDPELYTQDIYGETRGWTILAGFTENDFAYCAADMSLPELTWRFGYDAGGQWQVAVRDAYSGETPYGAFNVDGRESGITGWGDGEWVVMWPHRGEYDAIAQGNTLEVHLGPVWYQMQLSGTAAAALKVQECVQNRGRAPQSAAAPAVTAPAPAAGPVQMPDTTFRGEQFVGNCQTPYASYRCLATMLQPTAGYGMAQEIADAGGTEFTFVMQTDRADLSQVWVSYDNVSYVYLGLWGTSDGRCHRPLPDQDAQVTANLGQDAWELCIG